MQEPDGGLRPLSGSQMEALEEALSSYQAAIMRDVPAAQYLAGRGIRGAEATTFRLGVVADPAPGHNRFRGMLAIPYLDKDGKPLAIRFRCMENHDHDAHYHGKYNGVKGEPTRMFNIGAIHRADRELHVAEGELDAIILNKLGLPAVGAPGVNNFKRHHVRMLAGFTRLYIWGDPDDAGADFVNGLMRRMPRAVGVRLRDGDVTETYMAGGKDAILALIEREEEAA